MLAKNSIKSICYHTNQHLNCVSSIFMKKHFLSAVSVLTSDTPLTVMVAI